MKYKTETRLEWLIKSSNKIKRICNNALKKNIEIEQYEIAALKNEIHNMQIDIEWLYGYSAGGKK